MAGKRFVRVSAVALTVAVLMPTVALAQLGSGIAGVVKDTTGAVLPGVTVEAASPALIEKVRAVVTDDQGQYKIADLRPGVYTVTFTLPGFSIVKREGIELTANFTAPVNAELRVGTLAETVTVSGQSPVVDVQGVVQQRVATLEVIDALPTGRTNQTLAASLIPGLVVAPVSRPSGQDVGGVSGERQNMSVHGGRDGDLTLYLDGLPYHVMNGSGGTSGYTINSGEVQEFTYDLGAVSAEAPTGGIRSNVIPKDGGNVFKGTFFADYSNRSLQSDNLTDDLKARGLTAGNRMDKIWDINPSFGGPIKRDRLWFFGSFRSWGLSDLVAGMWYDKDPYDFVYTPDLSRQAIDDSWNAHAGLRFTWQATQKNNFALFLSDEGRCQCHWQVSSILAPEAARIQRVPGTIHLGQASWRFPATNRLLLEVGVLPIRFDTNPTREVGVTPDILSVTELSTGLTFRASAAGYYRQLQTNTSVRAALSYVTGSHARKVGVTLSRGFSRYYNEINGDLLLQSLNGVPRSVTVHATPWTRTENMNAQLGLFAQDQWTLKRLTLNGGIRFDHHNASVPEQHLPAVRFVPARDFAAVSDVPNWNDLSPRLGAAYDVFGTGKTALKVTLSRYVAGETLNFAVANDPVNTSVNSASRTWTDLNGNFYPDCDFLIPTANTECGALSNVNFGKPNITTRYDDAVRTGWGARGYNWETTAGVQHELLPRISVNASYFRRSYSNFLATDNLAVTSANYDPYCITAPVDSRLPGGGGNQVCGFYDINPTKFGQVNNLVTFASNYGTQWEHYNGVDVTVDARLPRGALVQGGLNTGRSETNTCLVVDSPQQLKFCDVKPPFLMQIKFLGVYPLPWDLKVSGTFQSLPGPPITANYVATSAQIAPSLGRNLASGANGTVTIPLIEPGTMYAERLYQVDVRLAKIFKVGRTQIRGNFDFYNALNASPVLVLNNTYGPAWQRPTYILPGRMFKVGVQVDF